MLPPTSLTLLLHERPEPRRVYDAPQVIERPHRLRALRSLARTLRPRRRDAAAPAPGACAEQAAH